VPMCSASQTAFSTFSDQLLESANLRKIHKMAWHLISSIWCYPEAMKWPMFIS